jgi:hypothetical protein
VPGLVLEGVVIEPRPIQERTTKFWGVSGESRIFGEAGGRAIQVPVLVFDNAEEDPLFDTARKLANYIDYELNGTAQGRRGTLRIVSESNRSPYGDTMFEGAVLDPGEGIKPDLVGNLGGVGRWFAPCLLLFRQLGVGSPETEGPP